ncbi:hypothetical protein [Lysobacter sp. TAB13]|jgi:hypothetical protein|uniref:hypothetical protein n=1 Tax=Lysobacter sp. TAB13 TaxID=3233065 RepID=UPI003F9B0150
MIDYMEYFIRLSVGLTGFTRDAIAPQIDPIDIKTVYLQVFRKNLANGMADQIIANYYGLNQAEGGQDKNQEAIAGALLAGTYPDEVLALRQLIYLWYMGAWPTVLYDQSPTHGQTFSAIVSATSYTQGLVWRVMQSHPMGSSNYTYGYWASTPPPLQAYLENPA